MVAGVDQDAHLFGAQHALGSVGDDLIVVRLAVGAAEEAEGRDHNPVTGGVEQGRPLTFVNQVTHRSQAAAPRSRPARVWKQLVTLDE